MPATRTLTLLARGARRRCPHCGRGAMFRTWFALKPRCAACGLSFERDEREDYWLGAFLLNFIVTTVGFSLFVLVVVMTTWPDVRWSLLTWGGVAQIIVTPIVFYPYSKALWLALDLIFRPPAPEDFAAPGDEESRVKEMP